MDVDCMVQNAANKRKTMAKTSSDKIGEWVIEKPNRNVLVMRHTTTTRLAERRCLLVGDCHWDNPDCDREHLAADLQSAVDGNCPILIGGDFFCAMQGKYDSRSNKNALRPEHANSNYLDSIVTTAADWLKPYASHIALICRGNHETSIERYHETDLTERLVTLMRGYGSPVHAGGYTGWVRFMIKRGHSNLSLRLFYRHGHGGGGPITQGKIDFNRYRAQADYDAIWAQHVHHTEIFDTRVAYLNDANHVRQRSQWHIRTPSYKDEFGDGFGGYQIERGQGPRPKGGVWLSIYAVRGDRDHHEFHAERTRA